MMSQVSRQWLTPAVENKIRNLLVECIVKCTNSETAANFVEVLLTETEKIMIAKRIAIAFMFIKGYGPNDIEDKLKVSLSTIYVVKAWLDRVGAEYRDLLVEIANQDEDQEKEHQFAKDEAQSFFSLRPHTNWKDQRRRQWQKVKDTKVPF